ncbi:SPOR domain-containing protein [Tenacibaculum sp. 190524A02b]|uniref:SPOR domain-containing protein n=1 Tax=Tenacibaculum vairaonense TaxID=3137860 RepID=UPI0031FA92DF
MKSKHQIFFFLFIFISFTINSIAQSNYKDTKAIHKLIEKKREYNKTNKTGFRIQLYNGLEKRAKSIKHRFQLEFPDISTHLAYKSPEWKIQVGYFKTRLDADRALNKIREKFSGAIVIPM